MNTEGGRSMFTKGIILSEADFHVLWYDLLVEIAKQRFEELDEDEKDELAEDRVELEEWVEEQVIEMFEAILDEHDAEEAVIFLKGKMHYIPDGKEFYYLSEKEGKINTLIEVLEKKLKGGVKESMRRSRVR
jgi:hypothetical protein